MTKKALLELAYRSVRMDPNIRNHAMYFGVMRNYLLDKHASADICEADRESLLRYALGMVEFFNGCARNQVGCDACSAFSNYRVNGQLMYVNCTRCGLVNLEIVKSVWGMGGCRRQVLTYDLKESALGLGGCVV